MTAGEIWLLVGALAVALGLYGLLLIYTSSRDRWPR
jgi:hypothetical protein